MANELDPEIVDAAPHAQVGVDEVVRSVERAFPGHIIKTQRHRVAVSGVGGELVVRVSPLVAVATFRGLRRLLTLSSPNDAFFLDVAAGRMVLFEERASAVLRRTFVCRHEDGAWRLLEVALDRANASEGVKRVTFTEAPRNLTAQEHQAFGELRGSVLRRAGRHLLVRALEKTLLPFLPQGDEAMLSRMPPGAGVALLPDGEDLGP